MEKLILKKDDPKLIYLKGEKKGKPNVSKVRKFYMDADKHDKDAGIELLLEPMVVSGKNITSIIAYSSSIHIDYGVEFETIIDGKSYLHSFNVKHTNVESLDMPPTWEREREEAFFKHIHDVDKDEIYKFIGVYVDFYRSFRNERISPTLSDIFNNWNAEQVPALEALIDYSKYGSFGSMVCHWCTTLLKLKEYEAAMSFISGMSYWLDGEDMFEKAYMIYATVDSLPKNMSINAHIGNSSIFYWLGADELTSKKHPSFNYHTYLTQDQRDILINIVRKYRDI